MKAIIPVAGAGTKLRPLTYTQPKPLIPVAGKAIIAIIIDKMLEAGVDDFVFILGYLGEKIENFVNQNYPDLNKEFVYQSERKGLGHAIWSAKEIVGDEEIIICLGDTIIEANLKEIVNHPHSCLAVKEVTDPRYFGVVKTDEVGVVTRVKEKPQIPFSNLAMVGLYKIKETSELMQAIESNMNDNLITHGEFQLTDGLAKLIESGIKINTFHVNQWYDCGQREILLETNARLLDQNGFATKEIPEFENTIIIQPVAIGENCQIKNSIIGPHVTIGDNTKINYGIISESIIGEYAAMEEVMLKNSIIGSDASIKGMSQSLNIGDNTEIDFR